MSDDNDNNKKQPKPQKAFDAYAVKNGKDGKGYFNHIGAAFPHRDGKGYDIDMAATPVNGRVTLRTPKDRLDEVRGAIIQAAKHAGLIVAVNRPFAQRDIAARHEFRGAAYEPSQLVTARERLEHMRNRARPAPQQHLRPKGIDHGAIQSQAEKWRERRINHIERRLTVADYGLNRDRMKAMNQDRAKVGFNKASDTYASNQTRLAQLRVDHKGRAASEFNHKTATKSPERSR